jgi:rhomboid family GlyGly-CTERM serine protease
MIRINALPLKPQQVALPLIVILLAVLAFVVDSSLFHYQRDLFDAGEYWRGLTSHFLHTNFNHLALNVAAVALLWALHGHFYNVKNYCVVFVCSAITATLGVHLYSPEISQYVGLSGVLHGFFVWGAIKDIQHKEKTGYLLLLGVLGKLAYEQIVGPSEDVAALISATVAIDAHLWGALGGALVGLYSLYRSKKKD